jgi:hypothetical protein
MVVSFRVRLEEEQRFLCQVEDNLQATEDFADDNEALATCHDAP